jgi:hypothetical protein
LSRYTFFGRRETIRRWTDRNTHLYVDRYGHGLFISLLLIVLLSVLDAHFTFVHMERGGVEINPLIDFLMRYGYLYCFVVKYIVTALAVFTLCLCNNFLLVRVSIRCILSVYLGLLSYHVFLFFSV